MTKKSLMPVPTPAVRELTSRTFTLKVFSWCYEQEGTKIETCLRKHVNYKEGYKEQKMSSFGSIAHT